MHEKVVRLIGPNSMVAEITVNGVSTYTSDTQRLDPNLRFAFVT